MKQSLHTKISCGILLYQFAPALQVLLVHPGGPFWKGKQHGAWSIPKGLPHAGEEWLQAAVREFKEETGYSPRPPYLELGAAKQKGGKTVHCWAAAGNLDAATIKSNHINIEWPYKSGRWITVPEVDEARWLLPAEARILINTAQIVFIDALVEKLQPVKQR